MPKSKQPKRTKRRARKPRGVADWSGPAKKHGPFGLFSNVKLFYIVGVIIITGSLAGGAAGYCRSTTTTNTASAQATAAALATPTPEANLTVTPTVQQVKQWSAPPAMTIDPTKSYSATIHTEKGDITADLFAADAPNTVNNFVFLARQGFYNDLPFYYVQSDLYAVTGNPTDTANGGPGYEIPKDTSTRPFTAGTLGTLAGTTADVQNGSQFFILFNPSGVATKDYVAFGQVTSGMDVAQSLVQGDKVLSIDIQGP
ncbi:MAG: peptidylprolyl isomerase [Dehalococcoidia bacterium]|jgi:cyclophilin family peptidyl-prolyl cis-trans isomerase